MPLTYIVLDDQQVVLDGQAIVLGGADDRLQRIADAPYKRSGLYVEVAEDDPALVSEDTSPNGWVSPRRRQQLSGYSTGSGNMEIAHLSVVRMGNMRTALAAVSSDGPDDTPNLVTVRLQTGQEGYGYPHIAHQTSLPIRDISLCSAYNPHLDVNATAANEKTLMLAVRHGTDPTTWTTVLTSNNYGQTWVSVEQSESGRMRGPRLVQAPDGRTYLFFRDSIDDTLRYYVSAVEPYLWQDGFSWVSGTATTVMSIGADPFDITHDGTAWVFAQASAGYTHTVKINASLLPETGAWTTATHNPGFGTTPEWVRVGRSTRYDEFGGYPRGTVLVVSGSAGIAPYSEFDAPDPGVTPVVRAGGVLRENAGGEWRQGQDGSFWAWGARPTATPATHPTWGEITNSATWNFRTTPSTAVEYRSDPDLGNAVFVDSHGPTEDDSDFCDSFAGFWTKSNERHSLAFPPFDPDRDLDIYFQFKPGPGRYHNIWFVVDDPTHPDTPIFKMDYYVGGPASGGHDHDEARGMAVWFCKPTYELHPVKTPADAPRGTFVERFMHPLTLMYRADGASVEGEVFDFLIHYDHVTDTFSLLRFDGSDYVPFVPFPDREYADVGPAGPLAADDVYVASESERYWQQPRRGLWPRRFYFGCPEVKPAFEQQSGLTVGSLSAWRSYGSTPIETVSFAGALVPRLSGTFDLWWAGDTGDIVYRRNHGHGWRDVWGIVDFECETAFNGEPDQATLRVLNVDNYERGGVFDSLSRHHVFAWGRGGYKEINLLPPYEQFGEWGEWCPLFFGTSDTGQPIDTGEGPYITMRAYSPLRDAGRSFDTQGFSTMEPLEEKDPDTGEPLEVVDEKKVRESQILYMSDFERPADGTLPVDSKGRLMHYEDYIARYAWEDMLHLPPGKLDIERVGFRPVTFTLNGNAGGEGDLLADLQNLWTQLGLWWVYDYGAGGVLRVWRKSSFGLDGAPNIVIRGRTALTLPIARNEDDYSRAGNVTTVATNMEGRPNHAVARVAPWPDGAGGQEQGIDTVNGLPSQQAFNEMYPFRMPYNLLEREWSGSKEESIDLYGLPYVAPGTVLEVELEGDQPASIQRRFAPVVGVWYCHAVRHRFDGNALISTPVLRKAAPYE